MLRALIIDDETKVRDALKELINHFCPQVVIVGEADGVETGLLSINELHPDLLLLDIRMKDGTGFDLLRRVNSNNYRIIFITAHEQFAIQAFKFSAVDYLLKPVDPDDLVQAIDRAGKLDKEEAVIRWKALQENLSANGQANRKLLVRTTDTIHLLNQQDILYCEAEGNYTTLQLKNGNRILTSRLLKEYEEMFEGGAFFRVHKSFLINLTVIERFEKGDGGFVVLTGGYRIPVASRKKEELISLFGKLE